MVINTPAKGEIYYIRNYRYTRIMNTQAKGVKYLNNDTNTAKGWIKKTIYRPIHI
jgi:hypothetical protein